MFGLLGYLGARSARYAINRSSSASNAAGLRVSHVKLQRLCPSLYFSSGVVGSVRCFFGNGLELRYTIGDMLVHGDARAAVVLSLSPLFVSCYCDDLDGVCVLRFADELAHEERLHEGDRLLTVLNSWSVATRATPEMIARDILQGSRADARFVDFWPLVADFLTDDRERLQAVKDRIKDDEFERCERLGRRHLERFGGLAREGRPDRSNRTPGLPWIQFRW